MPSESKPSCRVLFRPTNGSLDEAYWSPWDLASADRGAWPGVLAVDSCISVLFLYWEHFWLLPEKNALGVFFGLFFFYVYLRCFPHWLWVEQCFVVCVWPLKKLGRLKEMKWSNGIYVSECRHYKKGLVYITTWIAWIEPGSDGVFSLLENWQQWNHLYFVKGEVLFDI